MDQVLQIGEFASGFRESSKLGETGFKLLFQVKVFT
jgi:hypothetical protein